MPFLAALGGAGAGAGAAGATGAAGSAGLASAAGSALPLAATGASALGGASPTLTSLFGGAGPGQLSSAMGSSGVTSGGTVGAGMGAGTNGFMNFAKGAGQMGQQMLQGGGSGKFAAPPIMQSRGVGPMPPPFFSNVPPSQTKISSIGGK
jgi:pilus assembly protein FimV